MWHEFESGDAYLEALCAHIISRLRAAIDERGGACLAVSGGHSPIALFQALASTAFTWRHVDIRLVDERFVAPGSDDSNEHLVRTWLLRENAGQARFTGLVRDVHSMENCVALANRDALRPDVAVLGMGEDGHTASLFPGARQLADGLAPAQPLRYLQVTPPAAPHERISMTLSALLDAGQLILAIAGEQKRDMAKLAGRAPTREHPVSFVLSQNTTPMDVYWHA